jgi:hypothetical protein
MNLLMHSTINVLVIFNEHSIVVSSLKYTGKELCMRICITNPRNTFDDIDIFMESLLKLYKVRLEMRKKRIPFTITIMSFNN